MFVFQEIGKVFYGLFLSIKTIIVSIYTAIVFLFYKNINHILKILIYPLYILWAIGDYYYNNKSKKEYYVMEYLVAYMILSFIIIIIYDICFHCIH